MTGWDDLVSTALLGTERRSPHLETLPPPVREIVDSGTLSDPAATLDPAAATLDPAAATLDAAAAMAAYRRAGRRAVRGLAPVPAAAMDGRPMPAAAAIRRLAGLLDGSHTSVLAEWLRAANDRGYRIVPEFLPTLADLARTRPALRAEVARAAGPRGRWLAELNEDWRFLVETADPTDSGAWLHGTQMQRREWLVETRQRDPDAARQALAETWTTEPASSRADLLGVLAANLSITDEEFCEAALDDRASSVRKVAAGLLATIPGSRYGERMADRVRTHVTVRRRSLRRGVLAVTLPADCDAAMQRDGFEPWPRQLVGRRAWWLRQMIASAPLETLRQLAGSPAEFFRLEVDGCDTELVHEAVADAAVRERSAEWARALLAITPAAGYRVGELVGTLPRSEWAAAIAGLRGPVDLADVVGDLAAPWPAGLARAMLDVLARPNSDREWARPASARLAAITARAVPPDALDHPIVSRPTGEEETWRRRLVDTLAFRRDMYAELTPTMPARTTRRARKVPK